MTQDSSLDEQSKIQNVKSKIERAFITGAGGFVGKHLLRYLSQKTDWELFGNAGHTPDSSGVPGVRWLALDLTKRDETAQALAEIEPDFVFHLAAQSNVQRAFQDPEGTIVNNVVSEL